MKNIEFLVHRHGIANAKSDLVNSFMKIACKLVEDKINDDGGFAGMQVVIHYEGIEGSIKEVDKVAKKTLEAMEEHPNVFFMHGSSDSKINDKILETIDLNTNLYLSAFDAKQDIHSNHPQFFNLSRTDRDARCFILSKLLEKYDDKTRVIFLHDGVRIALHEKKIYITTV